MSNNFFDAVLNPTWKTLSNEIKEVVIQNILRHFVNPIVEVTKITPVSYQFGGLKIETFEILIDGVEFIFVPGQKKCILGWDSGLSGLSGLDCSEERQELRYALKRYCNQHLTSSLLTEESFLNQDFSHIRLTTEYIAEKINNSTSPLREVDIPALLVEKKPKFVGLKYIGQYNVISGQLSIPENQTDRMIEQIQDLLQPEVQDRHFLQDYPTVARKSPLLIQQNQFMLHPDTVTVLPIKMDSHLKYLGVVASYRDLDNSQWRLILLKQKQRWYQFGKHYFYVNIGKNELYQLSKSEMQEMLKEYKERHPDNQLIKENGETRKNNSNLSKGIFREE